MVLHIHSDVFAKMLSGSFQEAQPGNPENHSKTMDEEDVNVLHALIEFFYKFKYDVPADSTCVFHLKVYKLADFYQADACRTHALQSFKTACSHTKEPSEVVEMVRMMATEMKDFPGEENLNIAVMAAVLNNLGNLLEDDNFRESMKEVTEWTWGFIAHLQQYIVRIETSRMQQGNSDD